MKRPVFLEWVGFCVIDIGILTNLGNNKGNFSGLVTLPTDGLEPYIGA